jgi:hypothetical protein
MAKTKEKKPLTFRFGKYKGWTLQEIYELDCPYLVWVLENSHLLQLHLDDIKAIYERATQQREEMKMYTSQFRELIAK